MENKELLAQLKAFQIYLNKFIESERTLQLNQTQDANNIHLVENDSRNYEIDSIFSRFFTLQSYVKTNYPNIYIDVNITEVEHLNREIGFVLDTISNLNHSEHNQTGFKPNNQPFNINEIKLINNQLDDLQNKLVNIINSQDFTSEKIQNLTEIIKSELNDLKEEASNPQIGRKDWKNQLINAVVNLFLVLSFSQEARNTILHYFETLFVYLQKNLFLLEP